MVVDIGDQQQVDLMFHALADATRRDIVTRVLVNESSVSDLARKYEMSFAAVQKHVAVLERAEIVTKKRRGREQIVRVDIDTVRRASVVLDHFEAIWQSRLKRFGEVLAEPEQTQVGEQRDTDQRSQGPNRPDNDFHGRIRSADRARLAIMGEPPKT